MDASRTDAVRRRLRGACAAGALLAPVTAGAGGAHDVRPPREVDAVHAVHAVHDVHDVHVSQSRVLVDGVTIAWRLRVFEDDLQHALRRFARDTTLVLASLPPSRFDPLAARYLAARLHVVANGDALAPALLQVAVDEDPIGGRVRSLVFTYDAGRAITRLAIRHAVLFEVYGDQQNLVTLQTAGGRRLPLYFSARDDVAQEVPLR